jgi:hypothetical protein
MRWRYWVARRCLFKGLLFGKKIVHCKKELAIFPSQAGMSLTKLSLGGKKLIIPAQEEFDQ